MYDLIISYPVTSTIVLVAILLWVFNTLNDAVNQGNTKGYLKAIGVVVILMAFMAWMIFETVRYMG